MKKLKKYIKRIILGISGVIILFVIIVIVNFLIFQKMAIVVSSGEPIAKFEEQNSAMLVIDIQEATTGEISTDSFYKEHADSLIRNINRLTESYQAHNIPIIFIRSEITNPLINLINDSYAKGGLGTQFDKRLKTDAGIEVVKNRSDSFINTNLDNILNRNRVSELYILGLDAAHCVNATTEAAQNRKYKVHIIEDAVLAKSDVLKDSMMRVFKERGVHVLKMDSLVLID